MEPGQLSDTLGAATQHPEEPGQLSDASVVAPNRESNSAGGTRSCPQQPSNRRGHPGHPGPDPVQGAKPVKATDKGKG